MAEYDNTNTLVLFKNDKGDNPKRPDYRGTVNVDGTEFTVSAWIRESKKDGSKFLSGPIELKAEPAGVAAGGQDDDVPF